ncbi:MAG: hypothetical protein L3K18_08545 [Thermoplasmata archaeon]|nr:hypothetical protein [Thermoplasmata archaeon]MCI4357164.1 hypothetical protein [Thermoplasmata archaeon]
MSHAQRLPAELREFLALPGPQSLLVRGPPGSGKTTLCLALLEAAAGHRMLLTSRVTQAELLRGFPWLGDNGTSSIQIVDTGSLEGKLRDVARTAAKTNELVQGDSKEHDDLAEFLWLPSPIQEAWSRLPADAASIIVIDSWDALVEQYLGGFGPAPIDLPDRAEVERILLRQLSKGRSHVVIVLERRDETQLDYLVNGVIVTQREVGNDRLERWLHLPKLRGIRIANGYYPYTVEGARFQCIEPMKPYSELHKGKYEPEPDTMPGHLWPGSRSFAENFGRLPIGKTTLFETDADLPDQVLQMLIAPMVAAVTNSRGRTLIIPSPSLSAKEVWDSLKGTAAPARLEQGIRVIDVTGQLAGAAQEGAPELEPLLLPVRGLLPSSPPHPGSTEPPDTEVRRFLSGGGVTGAPILAIAYLSGFASLAAALRAPITPEQVDNFPAMVQSMIGSSPMHLVALGRSGAPLLESLRPLASTHLHLRVRQGRVFVYGSRPWTSGLVLAEGSGQVPYDLLRVV